tara:strand:- start:344 stop:562 length:219 start_codon:yes stop_codon:yes gene_type:complete
MFKDIKVEEIVVYLMLIVVGYYIAKMFSRSCNGFSVGGRTCGDYPDFITCNTGTRQSENIQITTNFTNDCCQ